MKGRGWLLGLGVLAFLGGSARVAVAADDDLSIVKRAVDEPGTSAPKPQASARKAEPQWLRVRIQEKGQKKAKVSVNLPLALVRAVGDDWPLDGARCSQAKGHCMTLGEVLRSLDAGQEIVQIEDETSTIRVYVE